MGRLPKAKQDIATNAERKKGYVAHASSTTDVGLHFSTSLNGCRTLLLGLHDSGNRGFIPSNAAVGKGRFPWKRNIRYLSPVSSDLRV
jgi:hypothetical protein